MQKQSYMWDQNKLVDIFDVLFVDLTVSPKK